MTTAQILYDLRKEHAFCSGTDLSAFFFEQIGDASPPSGIELPSAPALAFVEQCTDQIVWNSPSLEVSTARAKEAARRELA